MLNAHFPFGAATYTGIGSERFFWGRISQIFTQKYGYRDVPSSVRTL